MQQIIQSYRTGELWLADVPVPAPRSGGAVVRTTASLVSAGTERMVMELAKKSLLGKARARPDLVRKVLQKVRTEGLGSTMEKVFSKLDTPFPMGYSAAGTVAEVGAGATGLKVGDRVACAGAGYATHAEYNYIPKNLLVRIPDGVGDDDASFTTLGAIAMQGVRQTDARLGERVLVIGLGLLGLLTVQLLKASGCRVLGSDLDAEKCRLAVALGADEAVSTDVEEAAAAFSDGRGVDAVVITAATSSNAPIELAAEVSRHRGRVVVVGLVGMNVPRDPFYKKELDLRLSMSYGPGRYDPSYEEGGNDYPFGYVRWTEQRNMQSFLELVAAGRVTPSKLITHRFDIGEALKAYELLELKTERYLGIVINYPTPTSIASTLGTRRVELVATPSQAPAAAKTDRVGIGMIGAGNFAKGVLIPSLKRVGRESTVPVDLVGVCTATGASAVETGKKHGFAYGCTDSTELLKDSRLNAVIVATRHDSHARLAAAALEAGKHVFVEKPLCVRPEELELYERAMRSPAAAGKVLMVGFNRRFSPHVVAARDAFSRRSSPMAVTYRINAGAIPKESWTQNADVGGGRIIGEVCHFIDLCEFLIGSAPETVFADCVSSSDHQAKDEDSVVITIRYADGSLATIQYLALGSADLPKEHIEAFADGGVAVIEDFTRTSFYGIKARGLKTKQDKGVDRELKAFLAAVCSPRPVPPIPLESIVRTTQLTFQVHESLQTGRAISCTGVQPDPIPCESFEFSEPSDTFDPAKS